jgi:hypothetical protein
MSYLDTPRLHFTGQFQADVSTINNEVTLYDINTFRPEDQTLTTDGTRGGWNPEGTGIFRLIGCRVTGARLGDRQITTWQEDAVIGTALENADDRVFGKLVDLDPQQQMVSEIWGMRLRLTDGSTRALFAGDFRPAAFTNLWRRQQRAVFLDQTLAAVFQSVLEGVSWDLDSAAGEGNARSAVLEALRQASAEGRLSININVYGYGRDPAIPRYTLGRVAGTIGPYLAGEPRHFVLGRQMVSGTPAASPVAPYGGVYSFQCKVHEDRRVVTADFGNCLPIRDASGAFDPNTSPPLTLAVLKAESSSLLNTVAADDVAVLGELNYLRRGWYAATAGVQDFDYSADSWCVSHITTRPLALLTPLAADNSSYAVLVSETLGGWYARADGFVARLEPGAMAPFDVYATRYGKPVSTLVKFSSNLGPMGGPPPEPEVGTPAAAIAYPAELKTDAQGKTVLCVTARADGPGNPRGYIDGQLYGIGYQPAEQSAQAFVNFWNLISILAFDRFEVPTQPTWNAHVRPILQQYGNLYPIMSKHLVALGDYSSVVTHLDILKLAFAQPLEDPNHMPVTRDLSAGKRAMILRWMEQRGPDGLPLRGDLGPPGAAVAAAERAAVVVDLDPMQRRSKTEALLKFAARRAGEEAR